jgi:hypothetical protein
VGSVAHNKKERTTQETHNTYVVSIKYDLEEVESEFLTGLNWLVTRFSDQLVGTVITFRAPQKNISRQAK